MPDCLIESNRSIKYFMTSIPIVIPLDHRYIYFIMLERSLWTSLGCMGWMARWSAMDLNGLSTHGWLLTTGTVGAWHVTWPGTTTTTFVFIFPLLIYILSHSSLFYYSNLSWLQIGIIIAGFPYPPWLFQVILHSYPLLFLIDFVVYCSGSSPLPPYINPVHYKEQEPDLPAPHYRPYHPHWNLAFPCHFLHLIHISFSIWRPSKGSGPFVHVRNLWIRSFIVQITYFWYY